MNATSQDTDQAAKSVSRLDPALWARLRDGAARGSFLDAWLTLQVRIIGNVASAVVLLPHQDAKRFVPAASWPERDPDPALAGGAERAMAERRGVVRGLGDGDHSLSFPVVIEDRIAGAVALRVSGRDEAALRRIMRQVQWGAGWIELMLRRADLTDAQRDSERAGKALDVLLALVEARTGKGAAIAAASAMAHALDCERVAIGELKRRRIRITAISNTSELGRHMHLNRALAAAMEEAADQGTGVLASTDRTQSAARAQVNRASEALIREHGAMSVLALPLVDGEKVIGAVTLEHREADGFDAHRQYLALGITALVGPILRQRRRADRSVLGKLASWTGRSLGRLFGPRYLGRKLALLIALGIGAVLWFTEDVAEISAPARLEGSEQRVLSAPFDGYLTDQAVRPGDIVADGALLARFDDRDLRLQLLAAEAELGERRIELNAALAGGERTEVQRLEAQIVQSESQIALLTAQIGRTVIRAPFAGIVESGDRTQEIGAAISRGEELFVIAPVERYRVALNVDERDIADVAQGQTAQVRFASMPEWPVPFEVTRIMPVAEVVNGANTFAVEGVLAPDAIEDAAAQGLPLLPGMEGVGRIEVEARPLIVNWTARARDWLQLALWRWVP